MLQIPRTALETDPNAVPPRILAVGVGGAGVGLADRLALAGSSGSIHVVAIDSDSTVLGASVSPTRILIGSQTARGLGTGGDPELGADSAEESEAALRDAFEGANVVILCAGLGGGIGGGAGPTIASLAKNCGALVIVVATLPFTFEGKRRERQAANAAEEFERAADAFLPFENDRMSELSEPRTGVHETFAASDQVLAETTSALIRLALSEGPLRVSLGDLIAIFRAGGEGCAFGFAEVEGRNRANDAVERALRNPLMGRGKTLADCRDVIVHIEGAPDLTLAEVQAAMQTVSRHANETAGLHLGVGVDANRGSTMSISVLACRGPARGQTATPIPTVARPEAVEPATKTTSPPPPTEEVSAEETSPDNTPGAEELFDTDPFTVPKIAPPKRPAKPRQETLSLDPVNRGRFDKSEPTIVGGEDLDVPTFIRQKIRLK